MGEIATTNAATPFPYVTICSMCVGVVAQCIVFTAPLPFVAFMVVDFGVSKTLDSAGYSAGWIAGIYMIGRISSGVAFGVISDKWGRKPCLVISMINVAILGILFGMSTNYTMALITRCLCGVGNGFMSVCQTVITELVSNKEHETKAFGYVNGAFGLGYIIGPAIGGLLARPAKQYPGYISSTSLWAHYPYLLPCLICSAIAALAAILIQVNVHETMEKVEIERSDIEMTSATACNTTLDNKQYGSIATEDTENNNIEKIERRSPSTPLSIADILSDSRLFLIILMNFSFCCFSVMVEEVFPLWCVSSVAHGGLSWTASQVGLILFGTGIGLVTFQIFLYGPLMSHFSQYSSATVFCAQVVGAAIPIIMMPIFELFAARSLGIDASHDLAVTSSFIYALIVILYSVHSFIIGMVYATIAMLVNSSVDASKRGTMNGMTGTAASLGNFFAPVIGANLFAFIDSWEQYNYFHIDGRVVFVMCGVLLIALGLVVKVKLVPNSNSQS